MRTIKKIIFLCGIIVLTACSCEKKNDNDMKSNVINNESILGDWVNINFNQDTLFINDTLISRIDTLSGEPDHNYNYTILSPDSIKIKYRGRYEIYCPETTFFMSLDKQKMILTIKNFNTYFPEYRGDTFKKFID